MVASDNVKVAVIEDFAALNSTHLAQLKSLFLESFEETDSAYLDFVFKNLFCSGKLFIIEDKATGEILSTFSLFPISAYNSGISVAKGYYLAWVATRKKSRGNHLFKQLFDRANPLFKNSDFLIVRPATPSLIAFYENVGFELQRLNRVKFLKNAERGKGIFVGENSLENRAELLQKYQINLFENSLVFERSLYRFILQDIEYNPTTKNQLKSLLSLSDSGFLDLKNNSTMVLNIKSDPALIYNSYLPFTLE